MEKKEKIAYLSNVLSMADKSLLNMQRHYINVWEGRLLMACTQKLSEVGAQIFKNTDGEKVEEIKHQIANKKYELPPLVISREELIESYGATRLYDKIDAATDNLMSRFFKFESQEEKNGKIIKKVDKFNLFHEIKYSDDKGIEFVFHPKILPTMINLTQSGYVRIMLSAFNSFRTPRTQWFYVFILQWRKKKRVNVTIPELKKILGMPEKSYKNRYNTFKTKVLNPLIRNINESKWCDFTISYQEDKKGRGNAVQSLTFFIDDEKDRVSLSSYEEGSLDDELMEEINSIMAAYKEYQDTQFPDHYIRELGECVTKQEYLIYELERMKTMLVKSDDMENDPINETIYKSIDAIESELQEEVDKIERLKEECGEENLELLSKTPIIVDEASRIEKMEEPKSFVKNNNIIPLRPQESELDISDFGEPEQDAINRMINKFKLDSSIAIGFMKGSGLVYCQDNMEYVRKAAKNGNVRNMGGLLRDALEKDYAGMFKKEQDAKAREEKARKENIKRDKEAKEFFKILNERVVNKEPEETEHEKWVRLKVSFTNKAVMEAMKAGFDITKARKEAERLFCDKHPEPEE